MSKIVVTGGAGYVGSHVCFKLHEAAHDVVVVDSLINGHAEFVQWGHLEQLDLRETEKLTRLLKSLKPDAVFHLASLINVGESVQKPKLYESVNVDGTLSLLTAMKQAQVNTLVFSSSCAIYGVPQFLPLTEDQPKKPLNPYGVTKLKAEHLLAEAFKDWGLNSVSLRYFNAAGADPLSRVGEDHTPETHLIPLVLDAASGKRTHIEVFGTDYPTRDGTCVRDYVHVCDLADAHLLALKFLKSSPGLHAFNLGSEHGHTVKEIIHAVEKVTYKKVTVKNSERRPGDPATLVADSGLAKHALGWSPRFTQIEAIIEHAWKWHQS